MKKFLWIALILLVAGLGFAAYLWNKPHRTADDEKPVAMLTADALFMEFSANDAASNAKYLDKVVEVSGVVNTIGKNDANETKIALATSDMLAEVSCIIKEGEKTDGIASGTNIVIRGICNGYNTDVELRQAVISK